MASSKTLWLPKVHDYRWFDLTSCSSSHYPFISRYPDWSWGIESSPSFNQSLFLDMWVDWKLDVSHHWHGHALPFSLTRSSGLNGYRSHTVVWGINPLAVFRVIHAIPSHRPIMPVIAIQLRKALGASQSWTSTAQWSQRLFGLRIQCQATATEYVHDLFYATLFRSGRPISISHDIYDLIPGSHIPMMSRTTSYLNHPHTGHFNWSVFDQGRVK